MKLQKIISLNPSDNYKEIGSISISSKAEIDNKISKARAAQLSWGASTIKERVKVLEKLYFEFEKRKKEISLLAAREMGMPIKVSAEVDIGAGLIYMRGYLDFVEEWLSPEVVFENKEEIHYLFFEPKGVAGVSVPWNFPFCNFIWGVLQNLVVGNTVVFKHSEECALTGKLLEDIIESAKLPQGIFNEVYGDGCDIGEYLMNSNIDLMYFTGSTGVGKHLYQVAAKKFIPTILELGGSAPGIVFDDIDVTKVVDSIYFNRYVNSGQTCDGLKRLIVHKSVFEKIINQLKSLLTTKKIGNPEDPATDIGPLVAERQLIALEGQVEDALKKGAKVITGAKRPKGLLGSYYEPTILTNITPDMRVWKEEVFGLVLPVVQFDSEEEAIRLGNDTQYGLGAYVYTNNKERALRVSKALQTGNVSVNGANYVIAQDPFGGYKNSGLGREHGRYGLRELCSVKLIALKK